LKIITLALAATVALALSAGMASAQPMHHRHHHRMMHHHHHHMMVHHHHHHMH
jgi:hypothetical protein